MRRRTRPDHLIVHTTHHKMGTVWMATALRDIASELSLVFQQAPHGLQRPPVDPETDIYFDGHSRVDLGGLRPFRGSHMVRDLRDVVVSGYHYHLWTDERWARRPLNPSQRRRFGVEPDRPELTYVELLNSVPKQDGLRIEIRRLEPLCELLGRWDFEDDRIIEVHFEDAMEHGEEVFARMFRWWGLEDRDADRATAIAMRRHISRIKEGGNTDPHLRSGRRGQWIDEFDDVTRDEARTRFGELLVRMGYETDLGW